MSRTRVRPGVFAVLVALAFGAVFAAPRAQTQQPSFTAGNRTVAVYATVTNAQQRLITDLTRQEALSDAIVGREARAYDDLHAAEVLLQVRENQVQDARDDVEVQRQAAAEHLVTMEQLQRETRDAKLQVAALVDTRRDARAKAIQEKQARK